ncbi:MAG: hypothetical protein ACI8RD_001933 [Bacillariaceae sp.]|jgi:hypothetical protein
MATTTILRNSILKRRARFNNHWVPINKYYHDDDAIATTQQPTNIVREFSSSSSSSSSSFSTNSQNKHKKIVDLRSDTVTQPSQAMINTASTAVVGDDVMGEDPTVLELEQFMAEKFGKEKVRSSTIIYL